MVVVGEAKGLTIDVRGVGEDGLMAGGGVTDRALGETGPDGKGEAPGEAKRGECSSSPEFSASGEVASAGTGCFSTSWRSEVRKLAGSPLC